jgi:hypothetical protein
MSPSVRALGGLWGGECVLDHALTDVAISYRPKGLLGGILYLLIMSFGVPRFFRWMVSSGIAFARLAPWRFYGVISGVIIG